MEVNFELSNHRKPLGKKAPFIGQENCPLQSFWGAPEQSQEWLQTILQTEYNVTAQPGETPDFTPDLQNNKNSYTKNAISFASKLRF
jgi:hypothetical protein